MLSQFNNWHENTIYLIYFIISTSSMSYMDDRKPSPRYILYLMLACWIARFSRTITISYNYDYIRLIHSYFDTPDNFPFFRISGHEELVCNFHLIGMYYISHAHVQICKMIKFSCNSGLTMNSVRTVIIPGSRITHQGTINFLSFVMTCVNWTSMIFQLERRR